MKDKIIVYEFDEYRDFLELKAKKSEQKAFKSKLAEAAGIQSAYLSQVLKGKAQLNLEQALAIGSFLQLSEAESNFFLLIVQMDRAGTKALRTHFKKQIEGIRQERLQVANRLNQSTTLGVAEQSTYYSNWMYLAAHMATSVPELRSLDKIGRYLQIHPAKLAEVMDFLLKEGLVKIEGGEFIIGTARTFLSKSSSHIQKHHANWRLQALESLARETDEHLHYSSVFSISKKDALMIKDRLLDLIKENIKVIQASPEEELFVFTCDLFGMKKDQA